jgi:ABC-type tungstate transport system substrate-binding protein
MGCDRDEHHALMEMDPTRELGKWLILGGLILAAIGGLLFVGGRLPFRLGRLPGDIAIEGKRGSFYFPVVTCILLSVVLKLIVWVVSLFRR